MENDQSGALDLKDQTIQLAQKGELDMTKSGLKKWKDNIIDDLKDFSKEEDKAQDDFRKKYNNDIKSLDKRNEA